MKKLFLVLIAAASVARADTITENFATDPAARNWKIFGDTNLFFWDATNQNLNVTWDSSQSNSYFYHPLGTILGRDDDFQISFDLQLTDSAAGVNPDKPDALGVALGFLNFSDATGDFIRASPIFPSALPDARNVAEFGYFPNFDDPFFGHVDDSISPVFISSNFAFDGAFDQFFTMTNGASYNVQMVYTASNSLLTTVVTLTGQTNLLLFITNSVTGTNDFRVDTFSVSSYTDIDDPYDSLLAHGTVANLVITTPPPPTSNLTGGFTNNAWQVQFANRTNWLYTLQRTADFQSWNPASAATPGNGATLSLQDTNAPGDNFYYRILAQKP